MYLDVREKRVFREFIKCLRERHEFRMRNRYFINEFKDDAHNNTVNRVEELLKLSDEEILEKFGDRNSVEFSEEMSQVFDYLNEIDAAEKRYYEVIWKKLKLLTPVELAQFAKKLAQSEIRNRDASSPIKNLFNRVRQYLKIQTEEERRLTAKIRADLFAFVKNKGRLSKGEPLRFYVSEIPKAESHHTLDSYSELAARESGNVSAKESATRESKTEDLNNSRFKQSVELEK